MQNYSVLMSVYFKEAPEYLKQAIESIQAQTFQTDDFVLVCDGPLNDGLDAIIAEKQQEMGETLNVVRLAKMSWLPGWTEMTSVQQTVVRNRSNYSRKIQN